MVTTGVLGAVNINGCKEKSKLKQDSRNKHNGFMLNESSLILAHFLKIQ